MSLFFLLRRHGEQQLLELCMIAAAAGLGNAMIMIVASRTVSSGHADFHHLILFALGICIYMLAQRGVIRRSAHDIETIVHRLRLQVVDALRQGEPLAITRMGSAEMYSAIARDTQAISQAATAVMLGAQSVLLLVLTLLYLLWLSPAEFITALVVGILLGGVMVMRSRSGSAGIGAAMMQERAMLADVTEFIDGFKEIKASTRRADAMLQAIRSATQDVAHARSSAGTRLVDDTIRLQAAVYLLLAGLVFGLPLVVTLDASQLRQTVTALLFAAGSVTVLLQGVPILTQANEAAGNLNDLVTRLPAEVAGSGPVPDAGNSLRVVDLRYRWRGPKGEILFQIGPIDLDLTPGSIVFITGGNGSGKSTLLLLLASLLQPDQGGLVHGGVPVNRTNLQSYRDSVGTILSDHHLLQVPYGIDIDQARLDSLLRRFGLADKVVLTEAGWHGAELSGGQRKRLALVTLLLRDLRILILDEWAADQDPVFRRAFYQEILPDFRARGFLVICATHDDRYFNVADRCYAMKDGTLHLMDITGHS